MRIKVLHLFLLLLLPLYCIADQQNDGDALCAFRLGFTNWPLNPTPSPTEAPLTSRPTVRAPTMTPTIAPLTGWNCNGATATSLPCTTGAVWKGVTCSLNSMVFELMLQSYKLGGTISPSISLLTNLITLNLSFNNLVSSIPSQLSALSSLIFLFIFK